jgi:hypothetical protein
MDTENNTHTAEPVPYQVNVPGYLDTVPSVADPSVYPGSRILIFTHPGSRISNLRSWIPDPKTATKERGEKKFVVIPFFVSTNFTKL